MTSWTFGTLYRDRRNTPFDQQAGTSRECSTTVTHLARRLAVGYVRRSFEPGMCERRSHSMAANKLRMGASLPQVGPQKGSQRRSLPLDVFGRLNPATVRDDPYSPIARTSTHQTKNPTSPKGSLDLSNSKKCSARFYGGALTANTCAPIRFKVAAPKTPLPSSFPSRRA